MPERLPEKLTNAVLIDFPAAREILVSFPDEWELITSFPRDELPLYAAAMSERPAQATRDHFHGLSPAINLSLATYRKYGLFEPWQQPIFPVAWDRETGQGRLQRGGRLDVRLQPVAEAQAWYGPTAAVLWECFFFATRRSETWEQELKTFWSAVEQSMKVATIYTLPQEPDYPDDYTALLGELGYQPDTEFPQWWRKRLLDSGSSHWGEIGGR